MLPKSLRFRITGAAALALALPFLPVQAQEGAKVPKGLGPVETHNYWRDAASEGRFGDVFRSMPKSYQKDINGLIAKFGTKMDPDLWEAVGDLMGSLSNILTNQKEIIVGSDTFDQLDEEAKEGILENWDQAAELFAAFTKSEMLDLEKWKEGDAGAFLDGPAAKMMEGLKDMEVPEKDATLGDMMAYLRLAKAELVSQDGDSAVLRTKNPDGKENEANVTRVEGRWVPADLAENWESNIAEANAGLDEMDFDSPEFAQQKMGIMMGLGMGKQLLKQLEEAKSSADFDRTIQSIAKMAQSFGG